MNKHKEFVIIFFFGAMLLAMPFLMNVVFVVRCFENMAFSDVVKLQQQTEALYGTVFNNNPFAYKVQLYEARTPDILVLGSSRVMQFRQEFFRRPMVNCGGAVHSLPEGQVLLAKALARHKPEWLLLGIDFWWFHPTRPQLTDFSYHTLRGDGLSLKKFTAPFQMMLQGKLSVAEYASILWKGPQPNDFTLHQCLGLDAILHSDGFRPDGSYLYGSRIFAKTAPDVGFASTLEDVAAGRGRFVHGTDVSEPMLSILRAMIDLCHKNDVNVVLFLPPVAPRVAERLSETAGFDYVRALHDCLASFGVPVLDYLDISGLGSSNCEFVDGYHPGDVAVQRVLLDMAHTLPTLASVLQIEDMQRNIERFPGRVLTIYDASLYHRTESDFLQLGCSKNVQAN